MFLGVIKEKSSAGRLRKIWDTDAGSEFHRWASSTSSNLPLFGPNQEGAKHQPRPKRKLTSPYLYAKSQPNRRVASYSLVQSVQKEHKVDDGRACAVCRTHWRWCRTSISQKTTVCTQRRTSSLPARCSHQTRAVSEISLVGNRRSDRLSDNHKMEYYELWHLHTFPLKESRISWRPHKCCGIAKAARNSWFDLLPNTSARCDQDLVVLGAIGSPQKVNACPGCCWCWRTVQSAYRT